MKQSELEGYKTIKQRIEDKKELLLVLLSAAEQSTAIITQTPRGKNPSKNRLENSVIKIQEAMASYNEELLLLAGTRRYIDDWMAENLSMDEQKLYRAKYIDVQPKQEKTWVQAALEVGYNERTAYKIQERLVECGVLEKDVNRACQGMSSGSNM